jgi:ribosomal protein S25
MIMKKDRKIEGGFAALSTNDLKVRFEVREYKKVRLADLGADLGQFKESMAQLEIEIASAVDDLYSARADIAAVVGNDDDREIAEALAGKKIAAAAAYIDEQLACAVKIGEELIPRRRAVVAYINSVLSRDFHGNGSLAVQALRDLENKNVLVMDKEGKGPIVIGIQHYVIPEEWGLKESHLAKVVMAVAKFSEAYMAINRVKSEQALQSMEAEAKINLTEALQGKRGKCLIWVRGEPRTNPDGSTMVDRETGHDLYHPGGGLLVEFDAKYIRPLKANKGIERVVGEMVEARVRIPRVALDNPTKMLLDEYISDRAVFQLHWRFWKMCLNAIAGHKADEMQKAFKEVLAGKAEITAQQLLGINGSAGKIPDGKVGFLEFRGSFEFRREGRRVYNPHFLAKMSGEHLVLVEVPPQLNPILGEFVGKELDVSDNFGHIPFGPLMRAIKGQYASDHRADMGLKGLRPAGSSDEAKEPVEAPAQA